MAKVVEQTKEGAKTVIFVSFLVAVAIAILYVFNNDVEAIFMWFFGKIKELGEWLGSFEFFQRIFSS